MRALQVRILLVRNQRSVALHGLIAVLPGLWAFVQPGVVWLFGTYAIIFGVVMLVLAFRLRNLIEVHQEASPGHV